MVPRFGTLAYKIFNLAMKKIYAIFLISAGLFCTSTNINAQLLKNIGEKIGKKAEKMVDKVFEAKTTNQDTDAQVEQNNVVSSPTGPFKNIPVLAYDFKASTDTVFFDNFNAENQAAMASRWTSNGTGSVSKVPGYEGNWLKLYNENTYKIKELVRIPENFTIEFDLLTLSDNKEGITLNFGFDHQKGVGKHYYLAHRNPINVEASYRFDQISFTSNEVSPKKQSEIDADMSYFVNDIMKVKIRVKADRMSTYIGKVKVLDTEMINPATKNISTLQFPIKTIKRAYT